MRYTNINKVGNIEINGYIIPKEFIHDIYAVFVSGHEGPKKYTKNGWMNGLKYSHKTNIGSLTRHLIQGSFYPRTKDADSGLHPYAHLAVRPLMWLYLFKKNPLLLDTQESLTLFDRCRLIFAGLKLVVLLVCRL